MCVCEEACLGAAARAYRLGAVQDCGLVRAQLLDEHVAPGGDVGVEVLEGERVGSKAPVDAQVDERHHPAGRAVLARDVLLQARSPSFAISELRLHGKAKGVDARRLLGPVGSDDHHASSSSGSGHSKRGLGGSGRLFVGLSQILTQRDSDAFDQLLKRYKRAYISY